MGKAAVIKVLRDARSRIEEPAHFSNTNVAAYLGRHGWRACSMRDERAICFSLSGAIWLGLPGPNYDDYFRQCTAVTLALRIALQAVGRVAPDNPGERAYAEIDNWVGYRPHAEVLADLTAAIEFLENFK